MCRGSTPSESH